MTTAAEEHVLDESGHFHAVDEPIDLSGYGWEDWLTFVMFWLLALDVFYQFFTRYVLADSAEATTMGGRGASFVPSPPRLDGAGWFGSDGFICYCI